MMEGGQVLGESAAALIVSRFDLVRDWIRPTIVDHTNAAYRAGWEAGYREGLTDGRTPSP
jgi:hypothetical protein